MSPSVFDLFMFVLTGGPVWHSKTFPLLSTSTSSYGHCYLPK